MQDIKFVEEETKKAWRKKKATELQRLHYRSDANSEPSLKRQRPDGGPPNTYSIDTAKHDGGRAGATLLPNDVYEHGHHTNRAGKMDSNQEAAYPIQSEQQQQQRQQLNRGDPLGAASKQNDKNNLGAGNRGMRSDETRLTPTSILASDVIEGTSLFWVQVSESVAIASSSSADDKNRRFR